MGVIGINVGDTKDYILPDDRKSEEPTRWKLTIIDSMTKLKLLRQIIALKITKMKQIKQIIESDDAMEAVFDVVRFGLVGVSNFKKKNGEPIEFELDEVMKFGKMRRIASDKVLGHIALLNLITLAFEILRINNLAEDEAKNS